MTRTSVCGTLVVLMLGAGLCAYAQGDTDYVPGRPWTAVIPDPDKVDWTSPDRPGYRYRGMLPQHQRFYDLVQAKRARGEELSDADRRFIGYLVAARRWPEGPRPNAFWRAFLRYLREQPTDELNLAQRLMLWEALSRGLVPMDMPQDEQTRNVTAYLRSGPFRARNWFERTFGRVEPWMDYSMAQQGYDMGGGGPGTGVFPPTGDFNGLVIRYNFSGVSLGEPTDEEGFTTSRSYTGTVGPGTVTISGSGSISRGWGATLRVYASIGATEIDEEFSFESPGGKDFSYTMEVPPGAVGGQISIRLTGLYSTAGAGSAQVTRGLVVSAKLEPSAEAVAVQRDREDAEWRAQVEQTLRELGYEETPAGRELRELREALAGGDAAWREYCARKDAQMRGEKTEAETAFDALRRATQASEQEWEAYVATQTGGGRTAGGGG